MDSIYPVLSGALAQENRLELITNNLANVSTSGFKKDFAVFEGLTPIVDGSPGTPLDANSILLGADATFGTLKDVLTDFSPGQIQITGEPLDVAIEGEGFFSVQAPEGVRYTRNGRFTLNAQGQLVTTKGVPVLGVAGPITLPAGSVTINSDGVIFVKGTDAGGDPLEIDVLPIYTFPNLQGLEKVGGSLFNAVSGGAIPSLNGHLRQGALEASNVNSVEEMVAMIEVMRLYEAAQKAIQTADTIAAQAANEIGTV